MKADQYKKRRAKEQSLQQNSNAEVLNQSQKLITSLAMRMYQMSQELQRVQNQVQRAEALARYADYRSSALSNLLQQAGTVSEGKILNEIEALQVADFDRNSAAEDVQKNLETVTGTPAENGLHAIFSVKLFKDSTELVQERIVRSKLVLGDEEDAKQMIPGIGEAVVGMNVGETKRIPMNLLDKTDEAEITLLGLRKSPPAEVPQEVAQTENQSTN